MKVGDTVKTVDFYIDEDDDEDDFICTVLEMKTTGRYSVLVEFADGEQAWISPWNLEIA